MDQYSSAAPHKANGNKEFGKLCLSSFLFALAVYMLLPVLPLWMTEMTDFSQSQMASVMMSFGIGVFLFGAFSSYLIQRYRRNKVCLLSVLLFAGCLLLYNYLDQELSPVLGEDMQFLSVLAARFVCGAFFGLAYTVLNSTLVVDCCESSHRTRANVLSMWAYRIAVVLGPLCGLAAFGETGYTNTLYLSVALCLAATGVMAGVKVPFKAPDDTVRLFSFDRFFMPGSFPLILPTVGLSAGLGVLMAGQGSLHFYAFLAAGFVVSFLVQHFAPSLRSAKSVVYDAYIIVLLGTRLVYSDVAVLCWFGSFAVGVGMAALLSRLHVQFIHVGDHCQRGTAQSTYILSFEFGIALGMAAMVYFKGSVLPQWLSLSFAAFSALAYTIAALSWLKKNLRK